MRACAYDKAFKRADICQNYRERASAKKFLCTRRVSKILRAPCPVILYARAEMIFILRPPRSFFFHACAPSLVYRTRTGSKFIARPQNPYYHGAPARRYFPLPARQALFFRTRQTQITRSRKCDNVVFIAPIRAQQKIRAPGNEILRTYRRNYVKITKLKRHSSSGKASISVRELSVRSQEVRK